MTLNLISISKDGGTGSYDYNGVKYCLDRRINTTTYSQWYLGYPKKDNSNIVTDINLISLLNAGLNN